jgi:hypothetical protein
MNALPDASALAVIRNGTMTGTTLSASVARCLFLVWHVATHVSLRGGGLPSEYSLPC